MTKIFTLRFLCITMLSNIMLKSLHLSRSCLWLMQSSLFTNTSIGFLNIHRELTKNISSREISTDNDGFSTFCASQSNSKLFWSSPYQLRKLTAFERPFRFDCKFIRFNFIIPRSMFWMRKVLHIEIYIHKDKSFWQLTCKLLWHLEKPHDQNSTNNINFLHSLSFVYSWVYHFVQVVQPMIVHHLLILLRVYKLDEKFNSEFNGFLKFETTTVTLWSEIEQNVSFIGEWSPSEWLEIN